jgi:hypothetical protein
MVRNEFHMLDEYRFAISLDQGTRTFHASHMLSNFNAYVVWFLATLFGFKISAYRVLQVTSSILSAVGAVALIDLGVFWGLRMRHALLFSLPVILSNGFVRYATSAYSDASVLGMGLVAVNLLCRAVAKQGKAPKDVILPGPLYVSGLIAGIAALCHLIFAVLITGFILGIITGLRQLKKSIKDIMGCCFYYCIGFLTSVGIGYGIFFLFLKKMPQQVTNVESNLLDTLTASKAPWSPNMAGFFQALKNFGALFIPGVHHNNHVLDLFFDLPRLAAVLMMGWLFINALKARRKNPAVSSWVIPMLVSVSTLFFTMLFTNYWHSRQYATIGLAAFGPLFLALGILTLGNKSFLARPSFLVVTISFLFYMIFGIEGLMDISSHDSSTLRKRVEKCDIFTPKAIQLPWIRNKSFLNSECCAAYNALD